MPTGDTEVPLLKEILVQIGGASSTAQAADTTVPILKQIVSYYGEPTLTLGDDWIPLLKQWVSWLGGDPVNSGDTEVPLLTAIYELSGGTYDASLTTEVPLLRGILGVIGSSSGGVIANWLATTGLTGNPISAWTDGTNILTAAGGGRPAVGTSFKTGESVDFNGTSNGMAMMTNPITSLVGSLGLVIKPTDALTYSAIIGSNAGSTVYAIVFVENNTIGIVFKNGGSEYFLTGAITINDGVEYQLLITFDGATWTLYVDGVADVLTPSGGSSSQQHWFNDSELLVGCDRPTVALDDFFTGPIGVIRFWNSVLTAGQRTAWNTYADDTWLSPIGGLPVNTVLPAITGSQTIGATLTCGTGTWTNSPTITYQWKRNGVNIGGETASTYVIAGTTGRLSCYVTGTNGAGASTVRASTGIARQFFLSGDSLIAPPGVTTAIQNAIDAEYGAGKFQVYNMAHSGENITQMDTRAASEIDPNIDVGWGVSWFFEYANSCLGLQGVTTPGSAVASLLYTFGENRAAAGAVPIYSTSPYYNPWSSTPSYDPTVADAAGDLVRSNYLSHGGVAFTELSTSTFHDNIEANDGIHWTSAIYTALADAVVDSMLAADLVGDCGGIPIFTEDYTHLKVFSGSAGGTGSAYVYDPVTPLQGTPDPVGGVFLVLTNSGDWTGGTMLIDGFIADFPTVDGLQNLFHGASSPGLTAITGGAYSPSYATENRHEVSQITVNFADTAGDLNSKYFGIYDSNGSVGVYLNNGSGTPPAGVDRSLSVSYANNDSAATIAGKILAAMVSDGAWLMSTGGGTTQFYSGDVLSGIRSNIFSPDGTFTVATRVNGN